MKTNNEILDAFGLLLISKIIDRHIRGSKKVFNEGFNSLTKKKYNNLISTLSEEQKDFFLKYLIEGNNSLLFDFLGFFEENPQFKIIYEENGKQVNLVEISEMLKAEPIIENGWIARFSNELKDFEPL